MLIRGNYCICTSEGSIKTTLAGGLSIETFINFGEIVAVFKPGHISDIGNYMPSFAEQFAGFAHSDIVEILEEREIALAAENPGEVERADVKALGNVFELD